MSNIRLFYSGSLSLNLNDKLNKSQSHYISKVMRIKIKECFSLFNENGEWEAKITRISNGIVEFVITVQSSLGRGAYLGIKSIIVLIKQI